VFLLVGGSRYQPGRGGATSGVGGASFGGADPFTGVWCLMYIMEEYKGCVQDMGHEELTGHGIKLQY